MTTDAPPSSSNPFPGLRPFEFEDSALFFGREGQSEEILRRLGQYRFLAVVGASGSGKSSLVRAGLLPYLFGGFMPRAGSHWRPTIFRPGNDPIVNLAKALNSPDVIGAQAENEADACRSTLTIEVMLRRSGLGLINAIRVARLPPHENVLLIVDQFEELFRFADAGATSSTADDAAAFVKLLLEATRQTESPIYVVITMRSDFMGDCAKFRDLPEAVTAGLYLIPQMTRDQRRQAIEGPVRLAGGQISARLINRLLNDAGDNPDQLPILQHALMRSWDCWRERRREGEPIDLEDYIAIGQMDGALSRHADEAYLELSERHRPIAKRVFQTLTEKGPDNREVRRPTTVSDITTVAEAPIAEVIEVIDRFRQPGRCFLTPAWQTSLAADSVVDISHESLIRGWVTLKQWVEEEAESAVIFRRLAETATLHRAGKAGLYRDPDLQIALNWRKNVSPTAAWAKRYHSEFVAAMAFLDASRDARNAEVREIEYRRSHELRRARLFAMAIFIMFCFALACLIYVRELYISEKALKQAAIHATDEAQRSFDRAWKNLTSLYATYATNTLENIPGVGAKQAMSLKSQLRKQLLDQLGDLNKDRPGDPGILQSITALQLDEGREAYLDKDEDEDENDRRALDSLNQALTLSEQLPLDSQTAAETRAEILHYLAAAHYDLQDTKSGDDFVNSALPQLELLTEKRPQDWRSKYVAICLQGYLIWNNAGNKRQILDLSDKLNAIIQSNHNYEPIRAYIALRGQALFENFDGSMSDYELEKQFIMWFEQNAIHNDDLTLFQLENSANRFEEALQGDGMHVITMDAKTADVRRSILKQLDIVVSDLELRLPRSHAAYAMKEDLLKLQLDGQAVGIYTGSSPDDIHAAMDHHRRVGAARGVSSAVADLMASAFKTYALASVTSEVKKQSKSTIDDLMPDFMLLDLSGVSEVMNNDAIYTAIDALRHGSAAPVVSESNLTFPTSIVDEPTTRPTDSADPVLARYDQQMVTQYVRLFGRASQEDKMAGFDNFANAINGSLQNWADNKEYDVVDHIWDSCYRDLPIARNTSGEKEGLVDEMKDFMVALIRSGREQALPQPLNETLSLCDAILVQRPWDWYVRQSYEELCFKVAAELQIATNGHSAQIQPLLRRGWTVYLKDHGREELLARYPKLPLRGDVPDGATSEDAELFAGCAPGGDPHHKYGMERFTIPVDFGGTKAPFYIYLIEDSPNSYAELQDQFRWIKEIRGGIVPAEILDSFAKLNKIAMDNKVDFTELCVYALGTVDKDKNKVATTATSSPATQP
jgi:hypothetical protein